MHNLTHWIGERGRTMDTDRVNRWLTLGANVGVLAGLMLLAAEIRQNTEVSEMQFYIERRAVVNEFSQAMLDTETSEVWIKSIVDPQSLSPSEINKLGSILSLRLHIWRLSFVLEERGFRDKGSGLEYLELTIEDYFGNSAAQTWWKHNRDGYPADFAAAIDDALINIDSGANYRQITAIQNDLRTFTGDKVAQ